MLAGDKVRQNFPSSLGICHSCPSSYLRGIGYILSMILLSSYHRSRSILCKIVLDLPHPTLLFNLSAISVWTLWITKAILLWQTDRVGERQFQLSSSSSLCRGKDWEGNLFSNLFDLRRGLSRTDFLQFVNPLHLIHTQISTRDNSVLREVMDAIEAMATAPDSGISELTLNTLSRVCATDPHFWAQLGSVYDPTAPLNQDWYEKRGFTVFKSGIRAFEPDKDGKPLGITAVVSVTIL